MKHRTEIFGDAILVLGDCLEVMADMEDGAVDCVVTDPPYGVNYQGSATRWNAPDGNTYETYEDTPENVRDVIMPRIHRALALAKRAAITPGIKNARMYPIPDGEGVIWYPSGANSGPWGFITHQPIFYYGKCPYLSSGRGSRPTGFKSVEAAEQNGHPTPKPIGQMAWIVERVSDETQTILDPFMGSGTTGVACMNLGRKFIGIEIEERYFSIACRRIDLAASQTRMEFDKPEKPKQETIEGIK